jgi:hypothetical protein
MANRFTQIIGGLTRPVNWQNPDRMNLPPSHASTGSQTNVATPKGMGAPLAQLRPDVPLAERQSELSTVFGSRVPLQNFLRQRRTVYVTPLEVNANKLCAPGRATNFPGRNDLLGPISPGGQQYGYVQSAVSMGMYNTDYTQQTQMGSVRGMNLRAPYRIQNTPGYTDVQTQLIVAGQYSTINTDLAEMYKGLRAPTPFEGRQS